MEAHMMSEPYLNPEWLQNEIRIHGTAANVARIHGFNERTIQRHAKQARINSIIEDTLDIPRLVVPDKELMREITVRGNGAVTADWHIPITRYDIVARMIDDCVRLGATDYLVIAGDFFNFDALSDYYPKQKNADLWTEIQQARLTIKHMLKIFDRIIVTKGNHDHRLQKSLGFTLSFEHSLQHVLNIDPDDTRIEFTGRDYCLIDTPNGVWRACHTKNYSRIQLSVPSKIADIHRQHVAGAHRHHHAMGHSPSGQMVVELGGFFDKDRTEYLNQWSTDFPHWQNGYMILVDDRVILPMLCG